jgi:protein-S-isoprenylcysteine O-methyltransferase Ste14
MVASSRLPNPGVRFPPPFIYVAAYLVGLAVERWIVRVHLSRPGTRPWLVMAGWAVIVIGASIVASGLVTFRFAHTAIMPIRPASRIVRRGPYRFTRNPMYLGMAILYTGLTLLFDTVVPLLLLPLAIVAMRILVIDREERYLTDAFGEDYRQYQREVRRWL